MEIITDNTVIDPNNVPDTGGLFLCLVYYTYDTINIKYIYVNRTQHINLAQL